MSISVIYSTVCEVLGGRAKTADDWQFLDSAAIGGRPECVQP